MDAYKFIKEFFSNVKCNHCKRFFTEDSVDLVRQESNTIVVRIICRHCDHNLGLAILGADKKKYNNSLAFETEDDVDKEVLDCFDDTHLADPITYDEVIEAHKFFSTLGKDWVKYLPKTEE